VVRWGVSACVLLPTALALYGGGYGQ